MNRRHSIFCGIGLQQIYAELKCELQDILFYVKSIVHIFSLWARASRKQ